MPKWTQLLNNGKFEFQKFQKIISFILVSFFIPANVIQIKRTNLKLYLLQERSDKAPVTISEITDFTKSKTN